MQNIVWGEMLSYLKEQDNCRVNGQGWSVLDLHKFIERMELLISYHDPKDRATSIACRTLKGQVRKVYDSLQDGKVEPLGTEHKNPFSIYSV